MGRTQTLAGLRSKDQAVNRFRAGEAQLEADEAPGNNEYAGVGRRA